MLKQKFKTNFSKRGIMAAKKKIITKTKTTAVKKKSDKKSTSGLTEGEEKEPDTKKAALSPKNNADKQNEAKKIIPEAKNDGEKAEKTALKAEEERIKREAEEKRMAEEAAERVTKIHRVIKEIAEKDANEAVLAESSTQDLNKTENSRKKPIAAIFAAISFALILFMMITASINNSSKYYIRDTNAGLEIWKGQFAPKGLKKVVFLNGLNYSVTKEIYSKNEVLPIAFQYYLDMADKLIKAKATPDFETITNLVEKASRFAITPKEKETIARYKTSIKEAEIKIKTTRIVLTPEAPEEKTVPALTETSPEKKSSESHN